MRSFTVVTASFLCWISVSVSQSQTVDVQSGGDVTLQCSNISRSPTQMDWFRLVNRTKASCISSMVNPENKALFCDGFQNRFEMSSNISNVFLKIKRVDISDSGLYFCGFYKDTHTVIVDAIHLNVHGKILNSAPHCCI
uniref:Ig-like domain-containing protein n=1 Tax=Seriola dumerili TaxID=41447 RepID=A0A3B4V6J2_SERDU